MYLYKISRFNEFKDQRLGLRRRIFSKPRWLRRKCWGFGKRLINSRGLFDSWPIDARSTAAIRLWSRFGITLVSCSRQTAPHVPPCVTLATVGKLLPWPRVARWDELCHELCCRTKETALLIHGPRWRARPAHICITDQNESRRTCCYSTRMYKYVRQKTLRRTTQNAETHEITFVFRTVIFKNGHLFQTKYDIPLIKLKNRKRWWFKLEIIKYLQVVHYRNEVHFFFWHLLCIIVNCIPYAQIYIKNCFIFATK